MGLRDRLLRLLHADEAAALRPDDWVELAIVPLWQVDAVVEALDDAEIPVRRVALERTNALVDAAILEVPAARLDAARAVHAGLAGDDA
jgi:hypothetical protein